MANSDGTGRHQFVSPEPGHVTGVALSPHGQSVAILQDSHFLSWQLPDGTWRKVDLGSGLDGREIAIAWSPDGRLIVAAAGSPDGGGPGRTFLVAIDGTILAKVEASNPTWSPDGSRLAVSVSPGDVDPQSTTALSPDARGLTYLIARDGTTVQVKDAYAPAWYEDGASLAVLTGKPASSGIAVLAADGTGRRAVVPSGLKSARQLTWVP